MTAKLRATSRPRQVRQVEQPAVDMGLLLEPCGLEPRPLDAVERREPAPKPAKRQLRGHPGQLGAADAAREGPDPVRTKEPGRLARSTTPRRTVVDEDRPGIGGEKALGIGAEQVQIGGVGNSVRTKVVLPDCLGPATSTAGSRPPRALESYLAFHGYGVKNTRCSLLCRNARREMMGSHFTTSGLFA